jgi:hypothetical protein
VIRHSLIGIVALALMYSSSIGAQQQSSSSRTGWPCGGRLDPAYFDVAEATGGQLLLLAPGELGGAAPMLIAFNEHRQTIFRLAGTIKPGVHEFRVPIDASVESVVFSISVQCLQTAEITSPSGAPAGGEGVTDLSNFIAQRMVIVPRPHPASGPSVPPAVASRASRSRHAAHSGWLKPSSPPATERSSRAFPSPVSKAS